MDKSKEARISKEFKRLSKLYADIPANKKTLLKPTIQNAAFMAVTLADLQSQINNSGCTEEYQNGANQYGKKASSDLQAYNSMVKNYVTVIDRLDKALPVEVRKSKLSELMSDE